MERKHAAKNIVFYHGGCSDGFCAAFLFRKYHREGKSSTIYVPSYYGKTNISDYQTEGKNVFVFDFSFSVEESIECAMHCNKMIVLDHHETSERRFFGQTEHIISEIEPTYDGVRSCLFGMRGQMHVDKNRCGARLVVDTILQNQMVLSGKNPIDAKTDFPPLDYIEDRDLWKNQLPKTHEINAFIRSYPLSFSKWNEMLSVFKCHGGKSYSRCIMAGKAILANNLKMISSAVNNAHDVELCGISGMAVNSQFFQSEISGELAKKSAFGACYYTNADGEQLWSLRSSNDTGMDVSVLAESMGGGGHKHAAGFKKKISS